MTVWVYRDGAIVAKNGIPADRVQRSDLPSPRVSRFETMVSPVTEKDISSWRERDRDMKAADAVDPRDLPRKPFEERKKRYGRPQRTDPGVKFEWRRPDAT